jgi:hypothetical protein
MNFIDLLFALVQKFTPITQEEYRKLYNEAADWQRKLNPENANKLEQIYIKLNDNWMFRLGCAVAYIPLVRLIMNYMSNVDNNQSELI